MSFLPSSFPHICLLRPVGGLTGNAVTSSSACAGKGMREDTEYFVLSNCVVTYFSNVLADCLPTVVAFGGNICTINASPKTGLSWIVK